MNLILACLLEWGMQGGNVSMEAFKGRSGRNSDNPRAGSLSDYSATTE